MSVVDFAIECVKAVENIGEEFRRRARAFYTDIYVLGPAYVVALAAARSSAKAVSRGLCPEGCQNTASVESCKEAISKALADVGSQTDEKKSYAAYGAALLYILKRLGVIKLEGLLDEKAQQVDDKKLHVIFAEVLKELNRDPPVEAIEAAKWLKILAEAYYTK